MSSSALDKVSKKDWIVLKFGGTSVSTRPRWDSIASLIKQRQTESRFVLLVVSALSGVTNALQSLIDKKLRAENVEHDLRALCEKHERYAADELLLSDSSEMKKWLQKLRDLFAEERALKAPFSWQAEVLASGELLSSSMGVSYLKKKGVHVHWLDARSALKAKIQGQKSDWAKWLSVSCSCEPNRDLQTRLEQTSSVHITQGFIAANELGATVLLGRGGSDTSAAYFGALLGAERVEIWTDVAGMFTANPRHVQEARLLKALDFEEAQEIAATGAKVLHPRCLAPCREAHVELWVKDTNRPDLNGTVVSDRDHGALQTVKAISMRSGIVLVSMETVKMWQKVGFLAEVFSIFSAHGLSIDLIGSAETNVTVSLDPSENFLNQEVLSKLTSDLGQICHTKLIEGCSAISFVGRKIRSMMPNLAPVLAVFGRDHVHLLSQSSNNLNLTLVVDDSLTEFLMPKLHDLLLREGAMRVDDKRVFGPSWKELYEPEGLRPPKQPGWWSKKRETIVSLAKTRSPFYVYDEATLRERARSLKTLSSVDKFFYAMKANHHKDVLRVLFEEGMDIECVSLGELRHVRSALPHAGVDHFLFSPNFAPKSEYVEAAKEKVRLIFDNLHPLVHWANEFKGKEIMLRLDLGYGRGHHQKVVTGGEHTKFGLPLEQLPEFLSLASRSDIKVSGLHAHLGSGILDISHFRDTYLELAKIASSLPDIDAIDIGGGLGVPYKHYETELDLRGLDDALFEVKKKYPKYQLWLEPGRYLAAPCGALVATVTQTKQKGALSYVGLNAGMNALIRPALYDAYHEIVNLTRFSEPEGSLSQVVGPICETGDILGENRLLGASQEGDVFLIADAGAYGAVMMSRYNCRDDVPEIFLSQA